MANKKLVDLLLQDENANVANEEFETLIGSAWLLNIRNMYLPFPRTSAKKAVLFARIMKPLNDWEYKPLTLMELAMKVKDDISY